MTYLYLTSVFFTSLERGAQRKKSQREGAGEEKREPAREGVSKIETERVKAHKAE